MDGISFSKYTIVTASSNFKDRGDKETKCQEYGGHLLAMETFSELSKLSFSSALKNYPNRYQFDLAAIDKYGNNEVYWTPTDTVLDLKRNLSVSGCPWVTVMATKLISFVKFLCELQIMENWQMVSFIIIND